MNDTTTKKCCCPCHKMPGILLSLFGLSFLLKALGVIDEHLNNIIWPVLVMVGGFTKLCACKCCNKECKKT